MAGITPAISVFMFGNVYDGIFGKGVTGVKVIVILNVWIHIILSSLMMMLSAYIQ
jgi:hypothetical protein